MLSRLYRLLVLSLTAALALTACGSSAEPTAVRIGTQPWIGYGPWWIAQEKGIFEKYGLKAELVDFIEDKEVNAAFASGDMDAANLATHTAVKLYAAGLDLKIVLLEDASYLADAVLAPSSVSSIAGLKGMKVAYEEGTTSDLLINYALLQNGMTLADIEPVFMPASDAGATLIAGQVDAAVTYEPYISAALADGKDVKILYSAAERPGLISDVLAVRADLDPKVVTALLKVWDEALTFYNSKPDEAKAIIAKAVGASPEELKTAFDGVQFYSLSQNKAALSGEFAVALKDVANVAQSIGLLTSVPDLEKIVDVSAYP
ncbi:MAG: ABC transporter substrate-binding protein [Chloroflexi bacterium]|nr:ABC transporter substrate-binding protein [Chloroflexota bacterium]MCA2003006.1 ABC transporter substrate-binding protein [Chloroflexota bacterium]